MADTERLVALGVVARAHGLRGEIRVKLYNPESRLLCAVDRVTLRRTGMPVGYGVLEARQVVGAVLMTLDGVTSRSDADCLRGADVCVPRSVLPALPDGGYYHVDLLGLRAELPDGTPVGDVVEVVSYPTVDCMVVVSKAATIEVPVLATYLVAVRSEEGRLIVDNIDDLSDGVGAPAVPARRPERRPA